MFDSLRPWTVAMAPLSVGIPRLQEHWSRVCHFLLRLISWPRDQTPSPAPQGGFPASEAHQARLWACSAETRWYLDPVPPLTGVLLVSRPTTSSYLPRDACCSPLTLVYVPGLVTRATNQTVKTSYLMFICSRRTYLCVSLSP